MPELPLLIFVAGSSTLKIPATPLGAKKVPDILKNIASYPYQ